MSMFSRFTSASTPTASASSPSTPAAASASTLSTDDLKKELNLRDVRINALLDEKEEYKREIRRLSDHLAGLLNEAAAVNPASGASVGESTLVALDKLKEENEDLKNKLQLARDKVIFHNVDRMEQENKKLKQDNESLRKELDQLRGVRNDFQKILDAEKSKYEELMKAFANAVELKKGLEKELLEANSKILDQERALLSKDGEIASLGVQLKDSNASLSKAAEVTQSQISERMEQVRADHKKQVEELEAKIESMETERNMLNQKIASQKKDLRKLLKSSDSAVARSVFQVEFDNLESQNQRLKEELERKNKSLQNALEALQMQMGGGAHPDSTIASN